MSCPDEAVLDVPALITNLTSGMNFSIPTIDLNDPIFNIPGDINSGVYETIERLDIEDVTDGSITGEGAFDKLMLGMKAHLREEYDKNRITGAEYTKAYIAMTELAMTNAVQFLLSRESAFWAAHQAQIASVTARTGLVKVKIDAAIANITAKTAEVGLAVAALQAEKVSEDTVLTRAQTSLACTQRLNIEAQTLNEPKKGKLLDEQVETTRAQTLDERADGLLITGSVGKQKELYTQQITAYKRDSEVKAARIFTDAWITQKTIDEGLTAPTSFTNTSLDQVLTVLKENHGLTGVVPSGPGTGVAPPDGTVV